MANNITLEKEAKEILLSERNILVQAGPGAGKTELLAQKAFYIFENNLLKKHKKILSISFKKDSADNLRDRVIQRCGSKHSNNFYSLTFDAFCKMLIDQFRNGIPLEYRPSKDYLILTKNISNEFAKIYEDIFDIKMRNSYEKNSLAKKIENADLIKLTNNSDLYHIWQNLIHSFPSRMTFKMINCLAIYLLVNNKYILKALQHTFEYVFLDEFQDTTELQYELIKKIFKDSNSKLVAVGDSNQRIMVWAGADSKVFQKFIEDFNAEERKLIMNYRSSRLLVEFQKDVYAILNNQEQITNNSVCVNSKKEGEIKLLEFSDDNQEADELAKIILNKINLGVAPRDICILVKQKPEDNINKLQKVLLKNGVKARIETNYQDLIKENIVKLILSCLFIMYDDNDKKSWTHIVDFLGDNITNKELDDIDAKLQEIKTKNQIFKIENFDKLVNDIINILNINRIKSEYIEYKMGNYLDETINRFKNLFIESSSKIDFIGRINDFLGESSIPIMTIHKSKGLEYNTVIFIGIEDEFFWNFSKSPDEEKCTFFVALSRAKENLIFTFSNYRNGLGTKRSHKEINEIYSLLINNEKIKKIYF